MGRPYGTNAAEVGLSDFGSRTIIDNFQRQEKLTELWRHDSAIHVRLAAMSLSVQRKSMASMPKRARGSVSFSITFSL